MKPIKNVNKFINCGLLFFIVLWMTGAHASDLLSNALSGDVSDTFSGSGMFWKIFILVDVILATAMAVKTKNPMVFLGVAAVAFIPAFLIKTFVFVA